MITKSLFILCAVCFSYTAQAIPPGKIVKKMEKHHEAKREGKSFDVAIFKRVSGMIAINFRKAMDDVVKIKIYNENGAVMYKTKMKEHNLVAFNYDMSNVMPGKYYFEVSNKAERYYFKFFEIK